MKLTYLKIILNLSGEKINPIARVFMPDFLSFKSKDKFTPIN